MFVTLTYNDENYPEIPDRASQHTDVRSFLKRLRESVQKKLRYFICPEFGGKTNRLHYHGILFGLSPFDTAAIDRCWGKGFVQVAECNEKTIRYCTKYILKGDSRSEKHEERPTRAFMSRNPGLGHAFAVRVSERAGTVVRSEDGLPGSVRIGGKSRPVGRYLNGKFHVLSGGSDDLRCARRYDRLEQVVDDIKRAGVPESAENDRLVRQQHGRNAVARISISQSKEKL